MSLDLLAVAEEAAATAGEIVLKRFRSGDYRMQEKARHDLVTEVDRESEAAIRHVILGHCPGHSLLAEEGGWSGEDGEHVWIVDPLDGTTNFVQGLPLFAVSIACRRAQELVAGVILDPMRGALYRAEQGGGAWRGDERVGVSAQPDLSEAFLATGFPFRARGALDLYLRCFRRVFLNCRAIRRCGSAALDLAWTACGRFDGFFEFRLSAWDLAAGALLVREAGGRVTDLDGGSGFLEWGNVIAGSPGVHDALHGLLADLASEDRVAELTESQAHPALEEA